MDIKSHFDSLSISFFVTDIEATIVYANRTLEKKSGFALAELIGKTPGALWGGNMDQAFYERMWNEIRDKQRSFAGDIINTARTGNKFEDRIVVSPVCAPNGTIKYYLGLHSDAVGKKLDGRIEQRLRDILDASQAKAKDVLATLGIDSDVHTSLADTLRHELIEPTRTIFYRREDDRTLIIAAKEQSERFGDLYSKYHRAVHEYFFHRLNRDSGLADDLTQETFVRAFSVISRFEQSNASYLTYLLRIAHNLLVNYYRDQKPTATLDETVVPVDHDLDTHLDHERLWQSLWRLSDIEREIMTMKYQQGASVKEIADIFGKSENAIKLYLSRARKKLGGIVPKE